ncbi:MAG TPA: hypothetical protein VH092_14430 [Urbifossiella sp.]|jgi:hypothetical protein|nr:hypothetical protein [Urbifossiella sp.]
MLRRLTAAVLSCALLTGGIMAVSASADPPAAGGKGGKGGPPGAKGSGKSKGGKGDKGKKGPKGGPKGEAEAATDE